MSYKLPDKPADTPRVNAVEYASEQDTYGQICGLMRSNRGREIERDLNKTLAIARHLLAICNRQQLDDSDREYIEENCWFIEE